MGFCWIWLVGVYFVGLLVGLLFWFVGYGLLFWCLLFCWFGQMVSGVGFVLWC